MILEKRSQLDSIRQFVVNKFGLFTLTVDLKIPQIPEIDLAHMGFLSKGTIIKLVGDFLIVQDTDGREILYDHKSSKVIYQHVDDLDDESRGYGLSPSGIGLDRELLCSKTIDGSRKTYILNADSFALREFPIKFNQILDDGNLLLRRELTPQSLSRVSLDGEELWKFNIEGTYIDPKYIKKQEKQSRLSRILGHHRQLLWLANTSNELYALDSETGEKVFSSFDVGPADCFSIDKKHNRLVSLDMEFLRTIDLSSGQFELSEIEMNEVLNTLGVRPDYTDRQYPVVDSHLIFCDKFKSVVGTVGIDNGQIDWVFDLFDTRDFAMIKEMTYFSDKLYVLDNVGSMNVKTGSLHIFDRVF